MRALRPRPAAGRRAPDGADPRRAVLDNGLAVVVRPAPWTASVAVRLLLPAGGAADPPGRPGLAGLTAGLLDRGAGDLSARQIAEGFEHLGVAFAAHARKDYVEIDAGLLAGHLPEVLRRLRLILDAPSFPAEEIDRERGQVLTAIAERARNTAAVAIDALMAALFPEAHPYHAPTIGSAGSVGAIGRGEIVAFHRSRYSPSGGVLALAGQVRPKEAIALAAETLGGWRGAGPGGDGAAARAGGAAPEAATPPAVPDAPPPPAPLALVRPVPGKTQADIALGFPPGLNRRSPDLPAFLVLNHILGGIGLGGRLAAALREKSGLAYSAYSVCDAGRGARPVIARAGVAADRAAAAVRLMRRTIAVLLARGPRPGEFADARRALAASVPRRLETNQGAAGFLAESEFYGLGADYPERLPGILAAVRRDEVEAMARKYLRPGHEALVVSGPDLDERDLR